MLSRPDARPLSFGRASAAAALTLALGLLSPGTATAQGVSQPAAGTCPTFRVLHDDPQSGYDAGTYNMQVWGGLTCPRAVRLFQRFLVNPNGLPRGWYASPTQPAIARGRQGFSLKRVRGRRTPHTNGTATTCAGTVRVRDANPATTYTSGNYQLQVFGVVDCATARSVFQGWLLDPTVADLPPSWFPFADTPGFYYNRGAGGGFHPFKL